jgi:hypothetical protein
MTEQHYRITLADALAQYEIGLITATALVYYYIRIKRAEGWKITLNQGTTCEELGIERATFYKAIAKLIKKGLIEADKSNGIKLLVTQIPQTVDPIPQNVDPIPQTIDSIPQNVDPIPQTIDSIPQIVDSSLQSVDSIPQIVDSIPQTVDSQAPEPPASKGFDVSTNLYQIFYNSLSNSERESFLEFGNKLASQLPKVPTLPSKWIAANFEDIRAQWLKSKGVSPAKDAQNAKFDNHPQREEWLARVRENYADWVFEVPKNSPERAERQAFVDWAYANNLVHEEETTNG